jgi:hypothetical protein
MTSSTKGAIIGGCVGLAVMFAIIEWDMNPTGLTLVLWPSAVFGSYHGEGGGIFELVVGSIEVALQFLAYAVPGWLVGAAIRIWRKEG